MKDYSITEDLMDGITTDLETAYDYGYDHGYEDGKKEAWEAAKKIARMDTETSENVTGYFGLFRIMDNLTAAEAIEKVKAYEQKQDVKIKVGDEVVIDDSIGIVTRAFPGAVTCYVMRKDGSSGEEDRNDCKTTGRHFDQIAEVLTEMRGESE